MLTREAIRDRYAIYNRSGDKGRLEELAQCFTPDGVLDAPGYFSARGREDIVRCLMRPPPDTRDSAASSGKPARIRHFVSNIRFESIERDTARASAYFMVCRGDALDHWGTYRDVFSRAGSRWLLAHRSVAVDGRVDDAGRQSD